MDRPEQVSAAVPPFHELQRPASIVVGLNEPLRSVAVIGGQ